MPYTGEPERIAAKRTEAVRRWRAKPENRAREQDAQNAARREQRRERPPAPMPCFVGVDGEGWEDENGRHGYYVLVAGDAVLYTGQPLTNRETIPWLAALDPEPTYVGFAFDYDVAQMLNGFAWRYPERIERLLGRNGEAWHARWVSLGGVSVHHVPRKHLSLRPHYREGQPKPPLVTIHDVFTFFQTSFVRAVETFGVAESRAELAAVARMKAQRGSFAAALRDGSLSVDEIIAYCRTETRLLAKLATALEQRFREVGMSADPWEGPGPPAGRTIRNHVDSKAHREALPARARVFARNAYYGGRFEILAHGTVKAPVYEYDLNSAYPHAMTELPCLECGRWERGTDGALWVGRLSFDAGRRRYGGAGPLPIRREDGSIYYPMSGEGWYWNVEAEASGAALDVADAWSFVPQCEHEPFGWVADLYRQRRRLERQRKGSGIALKLTLNSLYGKTAQKIGARTHLNYVYAGLITALTRARLYEVCRAHGPKSVVMMATDAVFLTEPAPELELGTGLGQWSCEGPYDDLCLFMPGLYFDGHGKVKTRGLPKMLVDGREYWFRDRADNRSLRADHNYVPVEVTTHVGLRLGMARNKPHLIGQWLDVKKHLRPDPVNKRDVAGRWLDSDGIARWSRPYQSGALTVPYDDAVETAEAMGSDQDAVFDALYDAGWLD